MENHLKKSRISVARASPIYALVIFCMTNLISILVIYAWKQLNFFVKILEQTCKISCRKTRTEDVHGRVIAHRLLGFLAVDFSIDCEHRSSLRNVTRQCAFLRYPQEKLPHLFVFTTVYLYVQGCSQDLSHLSSSDIFQDCIIIFCNHSSFQRIGAAISFLLHKIVDAFGGWKTYVKHSFQNVPHLLR